MPTLPFPERRPTGRPPARRPIARLPLVLRPLVLLPLALLPLVAAGCADDAPVAPTLPFALAVRSDLPYVEGRIAAREEGAVLRLLVQASPWRPDQRVPAAYVTVPDGATLLWRDGRAATAADLRVGRAVVVWASGAELRSSPPQVAADAVLLER